MGFKVWGLWFGFWGLGFMVWGFEVLKFKVWGLGFRAWGPQQGSSVKISKPVGLQQEGTLRIYKGI